MNEDKNKEEKFKPVYRFDNEDWVIPLEDEIRNKNPKKYKKDRKSKKEE